MSPASPGRAATLTGINFFNGELAAKRLELLRELVPASQLGWRCSSIRPMLCRPIRETCPVSPIGGRHAVPAACVGRQYVEIGGLMGYGANIAGVWRQLGDYGAASSRVRSRPTCRSQATKFELVVNLKTAKALGIDVPPSLLARADEVIE